MTLAFRSNVGFGTNGTGTFTPSGMPAGFAAGDLLLYAVDSTSASASNTFTAPTGFTPLFSITTNHALMLYGRYADGTETAQAVTASLGLVHADIAAFSGTVYSDMTTIQDKYTERAATSPQNLVLNGGSLIPSANNELAILFGRLIKTTTSNGATFGSAPSGFTKLSSLNPNGANMSSWWGYSIQTTATTIASQQIVTMSIADSSNNDQGFGIVLKVGTAVITPTRSLLGVGT